MNIFDMKLLIMVKRAASPKHEAKPDAPAGDSVPYAPVRERFGETVASTPIPRGPPPRRRGMASGQFGQRCLCQQLGVRQDRRAREGFSQLRRVVGNRRYGCNSWTHLDTRLGIQVNKTRATLEKGYRRLLPR